MLWPAQKEGPIPGWRLAHRDRAPSYGCVDKKSVIAFSIRLLIPTYF